MKKTKKKTEEKSMNETVAKFQFKKRKYEVDFLLDATGLEFDIFDVTDNKRGELAGHISMPRNYSHKQLIEEAKEEIKNNLDNE